MAKGYVYLLECVSNYETSYKIGYTRNKDIKKRIISLQTGNKDKIRCIDSFESQNYAKQIETALNKYFGDDERYGGCYSYDEHIDSPPTRHLTKQDIYYGSM